MLHSTWIDAVKAGDVVRLLCLMALDVVFLNPGQAPSGRDEFSANFPAAHQQVWIDYKSEFDQVRGRIGDRSILAPFQRAVRLP